MGVEVYCVMEDYYCYCVGLIRGLELFDMCILLFL